MLFLHVWWRIMRFSQPLDGTLCIFVRNSNGVYEICFFSKLINRRQVDGLSSHPCFEELEWHRGRQLQCFRNIENSRQCPESTKKTQLCEILPENCRLQKKSLTSNITVVLVTCVVVIGVILSIMSSSFSVEWIVFLTFMSGNHSDQSRITGECDPTKHFSLPVFFIPFNLWSCTDLKWSATVLLMVKGKMDLAEVFYDFVTSQSR